MAASQEEDLDTFLTTVELKLRGPFSSLELAKSAQTVGLRQRQKDVHPTAFLERLSKVLHRTDKITQLRILTGILGFDPDHGELDERIDSILTSAQEAPKHEEWVRVIAGLVQGVMFDKPDEMESTNKTTRNSCRGIEANELLERTCQAIIQQVQELGNQTEQVDSEAKPRMQADANPTFAPFRYALLRSELLHEVMPDMRSHGHFKINRASNLLSLDAKQDSAKAQEEKEHKTIPGMGANSEKAKNSQPEQVTTPAFPGFGVSKSRSTNTTKQRPKSSMFLTTKKPTAVAAKGVVHQRRAGGAQALVGKGRNRMATPGGGAAALVAKGNSAGVRGRAMQGNARSRMKVIDDEEAKELTTEQQQESQTSGKLGKKKLGLKRKLGSDGNTQALKRAAVMNNKAAPAPAAEELSDLGQDKKPPPVSAEADTGVPAKIAAPETAHKPGHRQQDWRELLRERSNRLSDEDRSRIHKFFEQQTNPTPGQPLYKMKLHEERTSDPATGEAMKETFYLELDYTSFTSKQSKKIKRYGKD